MDDSEANRLLIDSLSRLLRIKENLLQEALKEGTILRRDDVGFLEAFEKTDQLVESCVDRKAKDLARVILGHIRQFNPFNSSDVEENELLREVVEDFVHFHGQRIQKLAELLGTQP